jgi:exodeoxyribonuclease VII small subunit
MKKAAQKTADAGVGFDESLTRLEALVEEMERGELTLEAAMQKHAEGVKLAQFCLQQLKDSEKAVNKVLKESGGVLSEMELILPEEE